MADRFLFRMDMAKENEAFLRLRNASHPTHVYAGVAIKVGAGWIPDFIEVELAADRQRVEVTLIELEASEALCRISCRKYLPERSADILRAFLTYLDSVIDQCRSTADPRQQVFHALRVSINGSQSVLVRTAGALRSAADFVEVFGLIDQDALLPIRVRRERPEAPPFRFQGQRDLTRAESDGLRRTLRILHAVVHRRDRSGSTLQFWRNRRSHGIDMAVGKTPALYPCLHALLSSKTEAGLHVDCDLVSTEIAQLWNVPLRSNLVSLMISDFTPVAMSFSGRERMSNVFDAARSFLARLPELSPSSAPQ